MNLELAVVTLKMSKNRPRDQRTCVIQCNKRKLVTYRNTANKLERVTTVKACIIGNKVTNFVITMKFELQ